MPLKMLTMTSNSNLQSPCLSISRLRCKRPSNNPQAYPLSRKINSSCNSTCLPLNINRHRPRISLKINRRTNSYSNNNSSSSNDSKRKELLNDKKTMKRSDPILLI